MIIEHHISTLLSSCLQFFVTSLKLQSSLYSIYTVYTVYMRILEVIIRRKKVSIGLQLLDLAICAISGILQIQWFKPPTPPLFTQYMLHIQRPLWSIGIYWMCHFRSWSAYGSVFAGRGKWAKRGLFVVEKIEALLWLNGLIFSSFLNFSEEIMSLGF